MATTTMSTEQQIKTLKIIHLSLLATVTIAYFVMGDMLHLRTPNIESNNLFYIFIPAIAVVVSNFLYKNALSKIDTKRNNQEKLAQYQTASIIRWAILEGSAFLILVLKPELLMFGLLILVYFLLVRPTEQKIESELNIRL